VVEGCVTLEVLRCLCEQLRGHGQVGLRAGKVDVAEVSGQQRQTGLDVNSLAVPSDEPMDGETVAQVMQARLPAGWRAPDSRILPQADEDLLELGQ